MTRAWLLALCACVPPNPNPNPYPSPTPNPSPTPYPSPTPNPSPIPNPSPTPNPDPPPTEARGPRSEAQRFIAAHNSARAKHCAGPLAWSPQLAAFAQHWADALRTRGCMFGHSNGQYGENLAAGTIGVLDPEATVAMWYDELHEYRFPDGGFSMQTGHFTQLVWRATTQVGCGHTQCNGNDIWVCEYDPPGNVDGEYRANVLPASCQR